MSGIISKVFVLFAACFVCLVAPVYAGPQIEVSFETGAADTQKLVHAQAEFQAGRSIVYSIFDRISSYPMLHHWIRKTTRVSETADSEEFLVEFAFPWPVGRQWSRVAVRHNGNAILWEQVDGSLKANHGRIDFTPAGTNVRIDYLAAIDIGLPERLTQSYKAMFVREFLTAAYEQARVISSSPTLALASER